MVWTAPRVTAAELECPASDSASSTGGASEFCVTDYHLVLVAGRDIGVWWLNRMFVLSELPAVMATGAVFYAVPPQTTGSEQIRMSWVLGAVWFLLGALQWWVIG